VRVGGLSSHSAPAARAWRGTPLRGAARLRRHEPEAKWAIATPEWRRGWQLEHDATISVQRGRSDLWKGSWVEVLVSTLGKRGGVS
jgi:hypothetical protein